MARVISRMIIYAESFEGALEQVDESLKIREQIKSMFRENHQLEPWFSWDDRMGNHFSFVRIFGGVYLDNGEDIIMCIRGVILRKQDGVKLLIFVEENNPNLRAVSAYLMPSERNLINLEIWAEGEKYRLTLKVPVIEMGGEGV